MAGDILEIGKWLRQEHKEVSRLVAGLRKVAAEPPKGYAKWLEELREAFKEFHARMLRHFELEEDGGYLSQVLEARPTLSDRIGLLESEHRQIQMLIENLHPALAACRSDDRLLVHDCCIRIQVLLNCIRDHEAKENELVSQTHSTDLGAAD